MATTIARLAAVLTTDTSQFQGGLQKAAVLTRQFQMRADVSSNTLSKLTQKFTTATSGLGRFGGVAGALGAAGGPLGLAAAAGVGLVAALARIGDAARDARNELAGLHTSKDVLAELQKQLGTFAEDTGLSTNALKRGFSLAIEKINIQTGADHRSHLKDVITSEMVQQATFAQEQYEKLLALARDNPGRVLQGRTLEELERSLSPTPQAKAFMAELRKISDQWVESFLDGFEQAGEGIERWGEQFMRDFDEAGERMAERTKVIKERSSAAEHVQTPALQRGTAAEFSARLRSQADVKRLEAEAKTQTGLQRTMAGELQKLNKQPPVKFKIGNL